MRSDSANPATNDLPAWVDEKVLLAAIESSGYPAQSAVARWLEDSFDVVEEWGYLDRDTSENRELDVHASRSLIEATDAAVEPRVVLLIESKRSTHPYVFFQSAGQRPARDFPTVCGLPDGGVRLHASDSPQHAIYVSGSQALGMAALPFVTPGPPRCASFSKAQPRGRKLELSGEVPYRQIVLPLVKSLLHSVGMHEETPAEKLAPTLYLSIAVLDGPMLLVDSPERANDPILVPWVRVVRHEAVTSTPPTAHHRAHVIDVVHAAYFVEFVEDHVMSFATEFADRVVRMGDVLTHGGEVDDLSDWDWTKIRQRARP